MLLVTLAVSLPRGDARTQAHNFISAGMSHELTFPVQAAAFYIVTSAFTRHLPTSGPLEGISEMRSPACFYLSLWLLGAWPRRRARKARMRGSAR